MDLKEFTFKLIILFFPGLLAFVLYDRLTVHKKIEPFYFVVNSLIFGILAYFLAWGFCSCCCPFINSDLNALHAKWKWVPNPTLPTQMAVWENLKDTNKGVELGEMGWTCLSAVMLALGASWASNRKIHYRFARYLGLSKKSGEMDVWGYVLNSRDNDLNFVTLRDPGADLAYDGWINSFSQDSTTIELLLGDVAVYRNSTSEFLYQVGAMYFKLDPLKVILEFRGKLVTKRYRINAKENYERGGARTPVHKRGVAEEGRSQSDTDERAPAAAATTTSAEHTTATAPGG